MLTVECGIYLLINKCINSFNTFGNFSTHLVLAMAALFSEPS
uniref:Uncharacterized protein n=1 Tax=Anguilla anguilla TaxID=7936 RepID=A0A0E9TED5_ANGAN